MLHYKNINLKDIKGEIWTDIVGFEDLYQVSNLGRVKSLKKFVNCKGDNKRSVRERIMKQNGSPYLQVFLGGDNICSVHVLVARAFISNPENKPTVNHKKGIKKDNRAIKLEWATLSEQMLHAHKYGLILNPYGWGKNELHPSSKPVLCISNNETYPCCEEASRRLKIQSSHIREVCLGTRKSAGGLMFKRI